MKARDLVDSALEAPVFTSFSRIGFAVRSRLYGWKGLDTYDMKGRVVVVTGATSGIGRAAATSLARSAATVVLVGRSAERNERIASEIREATGNRAVEQHPADMGDLDEVAALAAYVLERHERLDVLIHNAGALAAERSESSNGVESTVASQVVGPFLLTGLLFDLLSRSAPARVLTTSSGGMYTASLSVADLEMAPGSYKGAEQYARAKRAQVTLNEMWAGRFGDRGVFFHAMHPGWADTPGVDAALPRFAKLMGPFLRSPDQGADTLVWLAADPEPLESNGGFWLDRRRRSIHKLGTTRRSDTPAERAALWDWVASRCGLEAFD